MSSFLLSTASDPEIVEEIGRRLRALRKSRGLSQAEAARRSGLSRRTLYSAESGENPTLSTVIRLLRTYGRLGALDDFIPEPEVSPMDLLERRERGRRG